MKLEIRYLYHIFKIGKMCRKSHDLILNFLLVAMIMTYPKANAIVEERMKEKERRNTKKKVTQFGRTAHNHTYR